MLLGDKLEPSKPTPPEQNGGSTPPSKLGPAIKLAPMPESKQPVRKKAKEPAPQKPGHQASPPMQSKHPRQAPSRSRNTYRSRRRSERLPARKPQRNLSHRLPAWLKRNNPTGDRGRRGGRTADQGGEGGVTLGGREQRQLRRKRTVAGRRKRGSYDDRPRQVRRLRRTGNTSTAAPRKGNVVVQLPCTVKSFSEALGLSVAQVLGKSLELGNMLNITATLDAEMAELLSEALDVNVDFRQELSLEEKLIDTLEEQQDSPESLVARPPR